MSKSLSRWMSLLLSALLLFTVTTMTVSAQENDALIKTYAAEAEHDDNGIILRWNNTNTCSVRLDIVSGKVYMQGYVTGVPGTTRIDITLTLQKKAWLGLVWQTYNGPSTVTYYATSATYNKTCSADGGTYRVKANIVVYGKGPTDNITAYSSNFTY